jgi:hypothetical protein
LGGGAVGVGFGRGIYVIHADPGLLLFCERYQRIDTRACVLI